MTEQEAVKIITLLKSGKSYKKGYYHYGYIYFEYNSFKYTKEDLSINVYEPSITEKKYNEIELIKLLKKEDKF